MVKPKPTLLSRFQGCLMGVRLGDAMGMPWETMSRKKILGITNGTGVTGFVDAQQRSSIDDILLSTGRGFDAVESATVAIACALRHIDDPRAGLLIEDEKLSRLKKRR